MKIRRAGVKPLFRFHTPYCCYLLKSLKPGFTNRTYFGYTKNPTKRLRQHNGEIVGGAKATTKFRPWQIVCLVTGFPNKRTALQFEWKNHHPPSKAFGFPARIRNLGEIISLPRWTQKCMTSSLFILQVEWKIPGLGLATTPKNCVQVFNGILTKV